MDEELPSKFEVIVVGTDYSDIRKWMTTELKDSITFIHTGMVESIVAAACSRIGKTVLHLDCSDHYGGMWASFNLDALEKFIASVKNGHEQTQFTAYNIVDEWFVESGPESGATDEAASVEKATEGNADEDLAKAAADVKLEDKAVEWNKTKVLKEYRRFNIDLSPKLLYARGPLVELLISSNIARYAEFRAVTRVLTILRDKPVPVPCSRADVFATSDVSVLEKRMLMKLLTSFISEEELAQELKPWETKTLREYLEHKKLTEDLIHYVLYAIAGGTDRTSCAEGIQNCKRFLTSLGRYGNTPFLWSMYGSGELPQCFCRLCAVFGGVYCLNRPVDNISIEKTDDKQTIKIESGSNTLSCEHLVMGIDKVPKHFLASQKPTKEGISRAVFITAESILPAGKEQLTLLRFPALDPTSNEVSVIEVGPSTGSCPKGLFVVHFISKQKNTAKEDLLPYAEKLFAFNKNSSQNENEGKPKVLWSMYFNIPDTSSAECGCEYDNVYACSGPDGDLDFDNAVSQAQEIFLNICPGAEFLPRAPDPEEIVFEDDTAPGPQFGHGDANTQPDSE